MHLGRFGSVVGFSLQVIGGGVALYAPDAKWFGLLMIAAGTITLVVSTLWWSKSQLKRAVAKVEPWHLQFGGLVGVILFGCISLAGVIWGWQRGSVVSESLKVVIQPASQSVAPKPADYRPRQAEPPPAAVAEDVVLYLKFQRALPEAERVKELAASSGGDVLRSMLPLSPEALAQYRAEYNRRHRLSEAQQRWANAIRTLRDLNEQTYQGRPLDLESPPEVANWELKAPNQELFKDDQERSDYRALHFKVRHVDREAAALINDLKREISRIENRMKQHPGVNWAEQIKQAVAK
jgi:hypothetical protein